MAHIAPKLRLRGGVEYDGVRQCWYPVIHVWQTSAGKGDPDTRYQWAITYATESDALEAYRTLVRPSLEAMLAEIQRTPGATVQINQWGFTQG
jgi:hypothetical protein